MGGRDVRYSTELQSILSRFGAGPVSKDEVVQYLTRQQTQATERHAGGVLDDLEDEGYVETTSGEKGELVQFTDKAIDEVFG
jgi:CTP-dependent riboflavin kinase